METLQLDGESHQGWAQAGLDSALQCYPCSLRVVHCVPTHLGGRGTV